MAELKPCPFCGRTPTVDDCGDHRYFIRCKCGIAQDKLYAQKCDAVRRWNTRKTGEIDTDTNVPTNDSISRRGAIEAFKKELTVGESKGNYVTICSAVSYIGAKQILESLPSAQPDLSSYSDKLWRAAYERGKAEAQQWIPCSERLPEENGEYITTVEDGEGMFVTSLDWRQDWKEWGFLSYYGESDDPAWRKVTNAIAWMPLPKPYKEDGHDMG